MEAFEQNPMEMSPVNDSEQEMQGQEEQSAAVPTQEPVQSQTQAEDAQYRQEPSYTHPQADHRYYQPQQEQPYRNAGAGRRESPFADSPYVMNHQPGYQGQYRQSYDAQGYNPAPAQPKPKKTKKQGGKKVWKGILAAVLALTVLASGCGITAYFVNKNWEGRMNTLQQSFNREILDLEKQIDSINQGGGYIGSGSAGSMTPAQVYARNVGAVVAISNHSTSTNIYGQVSQTASSGSGFVISEDGYVVTNYHVVKGATSLTVILSDSREFQATMVGGDETNDLAVLKIEAEGLQYVTLGSSEDLIVGDQVVAIGNPLGELTSTLTAGYVSAKDRDVNTSGAAINMIQTDAAINSGNSGGPLFNMEGEVVGITTAKYSGTSASGATIEGIGFAIPIDDVAGMIEDLAELGYITGAYLGVMVSDMDSADAAAYGLPMGALVKEVTEGYCAEEAGIQVKDIIVDVGGYPVESINDLSRALRNFDGGDTTTITVFRGGAELTMEITLDEKPMDVNTVPVQPESQYEMPSEGSYDEWFDFFYPFFGGQ